MSEPLTVFPLDPESNAPGARPNLRFLLAHPAHLLALGFGSGLSRVAPGTAGTAWAWLGFVLLSPWMNDARWAVLLALGLPLGCWACAVTARNLGLTDPGCVVWDEVLAFWLVLWLIMPTGMVGQALAFGLFRFFDAVKPGPVGWADRLFHQLQPGVDRWAWAKAGFGIMLDDLVAAGCTLLVIALWRFV
ncbi:MAG: phosphatidylglycerophosphatase A family protein [Rhodoferax sp.]